MSLPILDALAALPDIHNTDAVRRAASQLGIDPHRIKRLRHRLLQQGAADSEAWAELPPLKQSGLAERIALHPLKLVDQWRSEMDRSVKLLFETAAGARLESVLLRTATGRMTLCLSSQVGCRVKCEFCATGRMAEVVNLTTGELLDQVVQASQLARISGQRLRNLVFMGMGEPLHNEPAVLSALESLESPRGFAMSLQRVIVSTVGIPAAMERLAERFPRVHLAVSLHAACQSLRERLIPLARHHPLDELRRCMGRVQRMQRQPLMIQYLMLDGVNDAAADAERLLAYLRGLVCHINLIPFNPIDPPGAPQAEARASAEWAPTPQPRRDAFAEILRRGGFLTTIRYSQGADIAAACGQLARSGRSSRASLPS